MLNISAMPGYIPLGNQRDFGHTIQVDLTAWADINADDWKITYTRPGESATYPVPDGDVSVADNVLTWTISEAVTAINGAGSVVIEAYRGGEMLKHSDRIMTIIGEGHEPAGEAPDPVADWIEDATQKLAEVDHFVDDAQTATDAANAAAVRAENGENERENAEGLRVIAEQGRHDAYALAEAARDGLYDAAESNRDGLFEAAETTRNAQTGDAIDRANTIAETLEGIAPLWAAVDISASGLAAGADPTASVTQDVGGTHLTVGIPKGDKGDKGDTGNVMYATFDIDFDTGELVMTIPDGYTGPTFSINDETGELEVSI